MSKLSLLDKLGILANLTLNNSAFWIVLVVLIIFGVLLVFTNKKNEKMHKVFYFLLTIGIIVTMVAAYHSSLGNMFQYMMSNFFIAVYFPTIAIYLAAIIAMNIIVWISIFSFKSAKQIRILNITVYVIMNYLMALLLNVINTNKLDIFDQLSLYGNKEATALIELSSAVFMIWVIFLILYKLILIYIKKDYKPKVKKIIVRKKIKMLPENYEPLYSPDVVYGKAPHNGKSEDEILLEQFSKQFTLEDYKLFARLLKEEQDRKQKEEENKVEFKEVKQNQKVSRKQKQKKQLVQVESSNILEEDKNREQQRQEIMRLEEERRALLAQEKELEKKEQPFLESMLEKALSDEEKEKQKLSELEMLYQ